MIYVITTQSGKELDTAVLLRKTGYDAYVPRAVRRYRRGTEHYFIASVMFNCYVFVELPHELTGDDYYKITGLKTVGRFLSRTCCLSETETEYIRLLCNNGNPIGVSRGYIKNGTLRVTEGWLKRLENKITHFSVRQHKATAEVTVYGQKHKITCSIDIEKA